MKKLFIILLSVISLTAVAQNQKIALLEPRAGEGSTTISGMEKAMVRGELRKAIVNHTGYEAFTRADIDQLMKEQDFQRTGNVSEADIHRMGEMSGADFICVSTLNKSADEFYLEAYLINVETGAISNPASQYGELVNGKLGNMLPVCQALAQELLGTSAPIAQQVIAQSQKTPQKTVSSTPSSTNQDMDGYVDLGLPSGTKWKTKNEDCGLITYEEAMTHYASSLPTKEQWEELIGCCTWTWISNGYKVTAPNQQTLFFPAEGFYADKKKKKKTKEGTFGMCWSSTHVDVSSMDKFVQKIVKDNGGAFWGLKFDQTGRVVGDGFGIWSCSIRLVQ